MKLNSKIKIITFFVIAMVIIMVSSCNKDDENSTGTFTDPRDGNIYKTVKIDNQVWMAENLKYLPFVYEVQEGGQSSSYYYVRGNDSNNVNEAKAITTYNTFGVFYNWLAAVDACPEGWHLPSQEEFQRLINNLGGSGFAGTKLKSKGTIEENTGLWLKPNNGSNSSGFTGLPGGYRAERFFTDSHQKGLWWSNSESDINNSFYLSLTNIFSNAYIDMNLPKHFGLSVRCIKD